MSPTFRALRNPNYRGSRPHSLARIEWSVGIAVGRSVAAVEADNADYAPLADSSDSGAAASGR